MKLPAGVFHNPRQETLIAKNERAQITIDTSIGTNERYAVVETILDHEAELCLNADWERLDRNCRIARSIRARHGVRPIVIQSVAHHSGNPPQPTICVVPNLATESPEDVVRSNTILGCDFGRHFSAGNGVIEVLEFQTSGMLAVCTGASAVDLWIARAGDKVALPNDAHATLYNLGDNDHPLVTLRYTGLAAQTLPDPRTRTFGPPLLGYYNDAEVVFVVNRDYIAAARGRDSADTPTNALRTICLARTSRQDLGGFLQDQFVLNTDLIAWFARLGINVRHADRDVILEPVPFAGARKLFFSRSLTHAVREGTRVQRYFFPDTPEAEPLPAMELRPSRAPIVATAGPTRPLDRPLVLVVEGAGDWVEQAYRKAFMKTIAECAGTTLSVFYADDTRWKKKPAWAIEDLQAWETYLDKADPDDYVRYTHLRPDAVFVVTPDALHAATASSWIGKTPMVFIEKPFDTDIRNVERLRSSIGKRATEIIGLDHYQFYAGPLRSMRDRLRTIVGDAYHRIDFVLAEGQAIEMDRERSLQHGLTLDLLPHLFALLTFFCDIRTMDEISVPNVWRYDPMEARSRDGKEKRDIELIFRNETAAVIDFTIEDKSGNGHRVPCRAVIGKGFAKTAKFLEVTGITGNALRIDLSTDASTRPEAADGYPWKSVFFIRADEKEHGIPDPYDSSRILHLYRDTNQRPIAIELEARYESLLNDLLNGTQAATTSSLSMTQGGHIVQALDRVWWAVQRSRPWQTHALGGLDPLRLLRETR
jgi:predicted dehydrogenase